MFLLAQTLYGQAEITYQGEILVDGSLGDGEFDFMFVLYDAEVGGAAVGSVLLENVEVREGLFTVQLDFGPVFDGSPMWLEIQVIEAGDLGPFEILSPRKPLGSAPEASYASTTGDTDQVDGADAIDLQIQDLELVGTELRITEGGVTFTEDLASLVAGDADMDPTNELNTAADLVGTEVQITDAGGIVSADLAPLQDGVVDADADPSNETLTSVALAGALLELIENGTLTNLVDVSALLNSGLLLDGTVLRVTDGGGTLSVDLAAIQDGVTDADPDPTNELNTGTALSGSTLEVTDAGGTLTADLSILSVDDADADPANELIGAAHLTNGNSQLDLVEAGLTNSVSVTALQNTSLNFDGTSLNVTDGGGTLSADISSLGDDADPDPTNELNTGLTFSGTTVEVTDAGGTLSADLSALPLDDADADPTNELIEAAYLTNGNGQLDLVEGGLTNSASVVALQNSSLSFDGTSLSVTDGGGTVSADISSLGDDADTDPTNELNTGLSFSGTTVEVTDAGGTLSADISALPVDDADADPTNELIDAGFLTNGNAQLDIVEGGVTASGSVAALQNSAIGFDGTSLSVTDGGGTLSADISALGDDADADPTNELNTGIAFSGTDLEITDAGGTLTTDLASLSVNDADADPTNELIEAAFLTNGNGQLDIVEGGTTASGSVAALQNTSLNFDGTSLSVTDGGGTLSVDISALEDDADADPTNELNTGLALSGTTVEVTDAGGTLTADLASLQDGTADADVDPTNELITSAGLTNGADLEVVEGNLTNLTSLAALQNASLGFDGTSLSVTDDGGTLSVDISALGDDADADPTNELNTGMTVSVTTLEITDAGGTLTADLASAADGTADADADPTNELISSLAVTNGLLEVVEGGLTNTLDVASLQNTTLAFDGTSLAVIDGGGTLSADISVLDDPNTGLALSGTTLQVTDAGGTLMADLSSLDGSSDLDTDPTNELITAATLTGTILEITEGGLVTGVDLAALAPNVSAPLYSNFGWQGSSDPVSTPTNVDNLSKVLRITEQATSNVFEVDFNRIRPGTLITNIPFTISQPGHYYLIHNLSHSTSNADGIIVDTNDVTIDLNGFSLFGGIFTGVNSDDGIVVLGSHTNIKIYNGGVSGWHGDGINALNADFSIFRDLYAGQNNGDGLVTDFNCLIERVAAFSNGIDGIEGDDGSVFYDCTAGQNGDNGIQLSEGSVVVDSAAFDNASDGFDIAAGGLVQNCVATDNAIYGFDIALGGQAVESTAYDNMSNGFDMASACILRSCVSSLNNGHGVRTFANSWITDNQVHENDLDGIRISSTDVHVEGNFITDNDQTGLAVTSSGCLIVRNMASGNVTNYNILSSSTFGPILTVLNAGDLSAIAGAEHPWANLEF
ncbi:MAG: hypothetical protein MPN21_20075 [Thermoanaerobaculia bacterium]|nr:hypothetical protein [Thermoanaerobaculia bacterium]